jgi:hypothetical protein
LIDFLNLKQVQKNSGPVFFKLTYCVFERPSQKGEKKAMWISLREYAREIDIPYPTLYARWRNTKLNLPTRRVGAKIEVELDFQNLLKLLCEQALKSKNASELSELAQLLLKEKK